MCLINGEIGCFTRRVQKPLVAAMGKSCCGSGSSSTETLPFYSRITAAQVRLRTNKSFQLVVVIVTIFAVFADILGTAVILPGLASVCTFAEGGPGDELEKQRALGLPEEVYQEQLEKFISPHAFKGEPGAWSGSPPVKYSLSMNLVMSVGFLGSAAGSLFLGMLCDKIGCKFPMQLCLLMGVIGYLIIYASAIWVKSYYLFLLGNLWNNFFGNCMQIATTYFGQLFEGAERDNYNSLVIGMGLIGGTFLGPVLDAFFLFHGQTREFSLLPQLTIKASKTIFVSWSSSNQCLKSKGWCFYCDAFLK